MEGRETDKMDSRIVPTRLTSTLAAVTVTSNFRDNKYIMQNTIKKFHRGNFFEFIAKKMDF